MMYHELTFHFVEDWKIILKTHPFLLVTIKRLKNLLHYLHNHQDERITSVLKSCYSNLHRHSQHFGPKTKQETFKGGDLIFK